MQLEEVLEGLSREPGVVRAKVMPDDVFESIIKEESTVTGAMGNMPIINTGLRDCMARNTRIAVMDDYSIYHPEVRTMRMVDDLGHEIGHSLIRSEIQEFMKRQDVMFISDDFVMYPEREINGTVSMELLSLPFRGKTNWIPEESRPVMWWPSSTSSLMLFEFLGDHTPKNGASILALDLD